MRKSKLVIELTSVSIIAEFIYSVEFHDSENISLIMQSNSESKFRISAEDKKRIFEYLTKPNSNFILLTPNFINFDKIENYKVIVLPDNQSELQIMYIDGNTYSYVYSSRIISSFVDKLSRISFQESGALSLSV